MPFYVILPSENKRIYIDFNGKKKPACVIAPHGHQGGGKESIVGRNDIPALGDAIKKFEYDYGMQLANLGYVTICPDARGYAERRELAYQKDEESAYLGGTCYHLAHMAEPLGMTVMGMLVWDLMRLVDFIYEYGKWDVSELGCVGFSGGGMQTLMTAALDERLKKMIISGYLYGYKDSLLILNGNCNCNYVPHLWEYLDMGDIGALLCRRKVIIQSCRGDHLNGPRGIVNAMEQVDIMRKAFALYNNEQQLIHDIEEGMHCWHHEALAYY